MKLNLLLFLVMTIGFIYSCNRTEVPFTINAHSVQEGTFSAQVLSPTKIESNYPMEQDFSLSQPIIFKLSINGRDNEAGYGKDHYLSIPTGISNFYAPTLHFGVRNAPPPPGSIPGITEVTHVHFRVNLRPVLQAFQQDGNYITATGDTIRSAEFQGLYIAGGTAPLQWIWDLPEPSDNLKFHDADQDSIYEISLTFEPPSRERVNRTWNLSRDISHLPVFHSPEAPLLEALTNLALEEALLNIRDDQAFSAGKEWSGVWTRDISYAAQLSLAYLFPENVKQSLRHKLNEDGRIIQDTGTGGSWPVSSDRHLWTLAAWEVYLATGDEDWLEEMRSPILRALQEDLLWNRDPVSGMLLGETSFEDWREQTYPPWMSPAQIHASHGLSTNIIFKRALEIGLALSTDQEIIRSWPEMIHNMDQSILGHFWNRALNGPASYLMANPAWQHASHRDILGESLGILYLNSFAPFDSQLVASYPRSAFGTPVISHQLPHSPPYHNKAIWPFVEAYGLLAAKQAGNQTAYAHGFQSLIRSSALFLSHRENFEYASGRPDLTQINSDRQLWSVAGWLAAVYKGLFGISVNYNFDSQSFDLLLSPNNPFDWDGYTLSNFELHGTPLSIVLNGSGDQITWMTINGEPVQGDQAIPLTGNALNIQIHVDETADKEASAMHKTNYLLPTEPEVYWSNDTLSWATSSGAAVLEINGRIYDTLSVSPLTIPDTLDGFFTLRTLDSVGLTSIPTRPYYLGPSATLMLNARDPYYIELGAENTYIDMEFDVPVAGNYLIRFIYSNGAGPINTGNTCGLANLKMNDWWLEQMISFPHTGDWDNLSTTAWAKANFRAGSNLLILNQETLPVNNMNGKRNNFRVMSVEIIPL